MKCVYLRPTVRVSVSISGRSTPVNRQLISINHLQQRRLPVLCNMTRRELTFDCIRDRQTHTHMDTDTQINKKQTWTHSHTHTHSHFKALFLGLPGWTGARRNLLAFYGATVHGKTTEADTSIIRLGATPSGLIIPHFMPDALPATTLWVYPGLG